MAKTIIYKARDGWRWRAKVRGKIVAESGEAYTKLAHCVRMAERYGPGGSLFAQDGKALTPIKWPHVNLAQYFKGTKGVTVKRI